LEEELHAESGLVPPDGFTPLAARHGSKIGGDFFPGIAQAFAGGAAEEGIQAKAELPCDEEEEGCRKHAEVDEEPEQHLRHQWEAGTPLLHSSLPLPSSSL
jgi:hypothetical protein